ncbi:MAG: hypothetical protein H0X52_04385 [Gemmatimonadetes bacterium]|nr:hypothetical protein [Gemmatimonadota bacterium]
MHPLQAEKHLQPFRRPNPFGRSVDVGEWLEAELVGLPGRNVVVLTSCGLGQ